MLTKLQQFIDTFLNDDAPDETTLEHRLQLASAALLVEMVHVDEKVTDSEETVLRRILQNKFSLTEDELAALIELAHDEKHKATDYYAFTSLINEHCDQQQKIRLVRNMWQLAYADNELSKYEEHLIRRLAELLHVPHHEFIRTKHQAAD